MSIGSARLQGLLRHLGPEWCAENTLHDPGKQACLVLVPEGAQHTLGATILSGQLRRQGIFVQLELDCSAEEVGSIVAQTRFDAVFMSATTRESLDVLRRIVQKIRQAGQDVPVVIGGNVLSQEYDVQSLTGVDLATSDLEQALEFCGFAMSRNVGQAS